MLTVASTDELFAAVPHRLLIRTATPATAAAPAPTAATPASHILRGLCAFVRTPATPATTTPTAASTTASGRQLRTLLRPWAVIRAAAAAAATPTTTTSATATHWSVTILVLAC